MSLLSPGPVFYSRDMNVHTGQRFLSQPSRDVLENIKKTLGPYLDTWCQSNKKNPNDLTLFRSASNRPEAEPEYRGRVGIFEVMRIIEDINKLVFERRPASEIEQVAAKDGMLLMKQDGYLKALEGVTTLEEVLRVAEV